MAPEKMVRDTVLDPALPDEEFEAAVRIAQDEISQHHPHVSRLAQVRTRRLVDSRRGRLYADHVAGTRRA
jgi:predicted Zn-dependent peptidase